MDTKAATYSDVSGGIEKGCSETHTGACPACSAQLTHARGGRSFVKNSWIVLGSVALIWLTLSFGKRTPAPPHLPWGWAGDPVKLTPETQIREAYGQCVATSNWTTYNDHLPWAQEHRYGAEATISLPLDSDVLYLVSRGAHQQGLVYIKQSGQVRDTVDVRIRVAYDDNKALERATICHMQRTERENGVGIITPWRTLNPPHPEPDDRFLFHITLTLPAGSEGPLLVKQLETSMLGYSHYVADLQESVLFERISLASGNGMLDIQSVTSEVGHFTSLIGEISGTFNARSSLSLDTWGGRITPTVNLLYREGASPSNLTIHTIDGRIDAEVSLTSEALTGGEFEVDAQTRNGDIGLTFTRTPVDSVLRCNAETSVGPIKIELDSAFEGTYSLQSALGEGYVTEYCGTEDPTGRARYRFMSQNESAGQVEGELRWAEKVGNSSGKEGHVVLKTVGSSVDLFV